MKHTVSRHSGNYAALLLLLFGLAVGADWLLVELGQQPLLGCMLRPFLYLVLSRAAAIWIMSIGFVLLLFARTKSTGLALLGAGILIGTLPELLEAYLKPLCSTR